MTTRRTFLKGAAAVALIPVVNLPGLAQAATKVPLDDATAKALKYVEDATQATRT
ncbi:MAG: twin-arginine translocation signal domain-containing protein, partial [Pseudomonadales bacterium]